VIDARDEEMGAWFEARIVKISPSANCRDVDNNNDDDSPLQSEHSSLSGCNGMTEEGTGGDTDASTPPAADKALTDDNDGFLYSIVFER